jgi:hypothetical protein
VVLLELSGDEFTTLASCGHRPPALPVPGLVYLFGTIPRLRSCGAETFQTTSPGDSVLPFGDSNADTLVTRCRLVRTQPAEECSPGGLLSSGRSRHLPGAFPAERLELVPAASQDYMLRCGVAVWLVRCSELSPGVACSVPAASQDYWFCSCWVVQSPAQNL